MARAPTTLPMSAGIATSLRARREAAGLSQEALAGAIGITRQSLLATERGRQIPSTAVALRLARSLGCRVEDLFHLERPASSLRVLAARPAPANGRVAIGRVDGRWIAHPLAPDASTAADAMLPRETGAGRAAEVVPFGAPAEMEGHVLVAGCAPALGSLSHRLERPGIDARMRWLPYGSGRALEQLSKGLVHVAGLHLHDARRGEDNVPFVRRRFADRRMLVVNLVTWQQGLVCAPGNPHGIRGIDDLLRPGLRVAQREEGAGATKLLRRRLAEHGARATRLVGPSVEGHHAVGHAVVLGAADVGIAIESIAAARGLAFVPLAQERFDLVLSAEHAGEPAVARLLAAIDDPAFRRELSGLGGYGTAHTGHVATIEPEVASR